MENIIEVNNIKYIPKENKKRNISRKTLPLLTMDMMLTNPFMITNSYHMPRVKKERERPQIDIVKEYGLIQLKKSELSRSKRDWVVWVFERRYKKID